MDLKKYFTPEQIAEIENPGAPDARIHYITDLKTYQNPLRFLVAPMLGFVTQAASGVLGVTAMVKEMPKETLDRITILFTPVVFDDPDSQVAEDAGKLLEEFRSNPYYAKEIVATHYPFDPRIILFVFDVPAKFKDDWAKVYSYDWDNLSEQFWEHYHAWAAKHDPEAYAEEGDTWRKMIEDSATAAKEANPEFIKSVSEQVEALREKLAGQQEARTIQ